MIAPLCWRISPLTILPCLPLKSTDNHHKRRVVSSLSCDSRFVPSKSTAAINKSSPSSVSAAGRSHRHDCSNDPPRHRLTPVYPITRDTWNLFCSSHSFEPCSIDGLDLYLAFSSRYEWKVSGVPEGFSASYCLECSARVLLHTSCNNTNTLFVALY